MNIETVNELIASLESAGELSIREQKFLKLAKAFRICSASLDAAIKTGNVLADQNSQLAAENAALKSAVDHTIEWIESTNGDPCDVVILKGIRTPATDRIVAGIKADGVASVKSAFEKHIQSTSCYQDEIVGIESALSISCQVESQLREEANHD
ncbi:TPA: hypothetical protein ACN7NB_000093 [Klebsiella pneumoniae]|uniref:hypothetical protein n=1 Tax=Klebsiella pneumoniae TaxID=573 RepID=UPI00232DAE4D|nr:hypothetical protein [Klebsiella pneumoniae]